MTRKMPEALRDAAKAAERQGWTITCTGGNHLRWQSPTGATIFSPSTPSTRRGIQNHIARLRKAGLEI